MKTAVVMKRELFGCEVEQNSKTEMFNATTLSKAGNKWRQDNGLSEFNLSQWLKTKTTQEFIDTLKQKYDNVIIVGRGRSSATWVHPLLFIDMALALSPTLKVEVYQWLFDNLIKYRNDSGDSYKEMTGALFLNMDNKSEFAKYITNVATKIKDHCGVTDWQTATEAQLKKRDKIHDAIVLLVGVVRSNDEAVRLALEKNK